MTVVGIYGGSFSPVHLGHMEVARGVLNQGLADEVWLMPCRRNPLKSSFPSLDDDTRIQMLRQAVAYYEVTYDERRIKVSEAEFSLPSPSYTADTLKWLKLNNPDCNFRIITGSDSYLGFKEWKEWDWLEKEFHPIVYPRPGFKIEELRETWTEIKGVRQIDISSSEIRDMWASGLDALKMMPWLKDNP